MVVVDFVAMTVMNVIMRRSWIVVVIVVVFIIVVFFFVVVVVFRGPLCRTSRDADLYDMSVVCCTVPVWKNVCICYCWVV